MTVKQFRDTELTNTGFSVSNKAALGKTQYSTTRAVTTDVDLSSYKVDDLKNLTSLPNEINSGIITDYDMPGNNVSAIKINFNNSNFKDGYVVRAVGMYAKESGSDKEFLHSITVSDSPVYIPAVSGNVFDGFYLTMAIFTGNNKNINIKIADETNATVKYVDDAVNSNASSLTAQQTSYAGSVSSTISSNANSLQTYISSAANSMQTALTTNSSNNSSYVSSATNSLTSYVASQVASMQSAVSSNATNITANSNAISSNATNISNLQSSVANNSSAISSNANSASSAVGSLQTSINSNSSAISSNAVNIANNSNAISSNANLTSQAVTQINNNISNVQNNVNNLSNNTYVAQPSLQSGVDLNNVTNTGLYPFWGLQFTNDPYPGQVHWGTLRVTNYGNVVAQEHITYDGIMFRTWSGGSGWNPWKKLGGVEPAQQYRGLWQGRGYGDLNGQPDGIYSIDINVQPRDSSLPSACSGYGTLTLTTNWTGFDRYIVIHDSANNMFRNHAFGNSGNNNGWVQF